MALTPTAKTLAGAALQPRKPKATTSSTRFTATEITDTSEYLTNFLPVGERANSIRALGRRSTNSDRTYSAFRRAIWPSHRELGFGVRAWVARSTATRPKVGR